MATLWTLLLGAATLFAYGCFIFVIILAVFIAIAAIVAIHDKMKGD